VPHNPFANDLFLPVLLRVVVLLLAGFAAVLVARRRWSLRVLRRSTLVLRARVWFLIGPLFVVAVFIGGFVSFLLATYVILQGSSEIVRIAGIQRRYALLLMLWGEIGLLVAAFVGGYVVFLPFGFLILLTLLPILSRDLTDAHRQVADTLFAYIYIGLPMAYIVFVKSAEPLGLNFLVVVTIAVAVSDIGSWVVGRALGGPRLLDEIAPGKTWSGALGNLLGAGVAVALLWVAVPKSWSIAVVVVLVVMIGLGSLWGDLTDAFVKRAFSTTATSTLVIGYGGVLDRVVSLLMAFPLSYFAVLVTQRIMR
jgi:phosphatidate cytidylyltransferase